MTVGGKAVTWPDLLPHLLTIHKAEGFYRRSVWRCRCVAGRCHAVPDRDLPGGAWSRCPYDLLRGVHFRATLALVDAAKVSPLAAWPDGYPAWLGWAVVLATHRLQPEKKGGKP